MKKKIDLLEMSFITVSFKNNTKMNFQFQMKNISYLALHKMRIKYRFTFLFDYLQTNSIHRKMHLF